MKQRTFKSSANCGFSEGENIRTISLTVPNQTMSLRELLTRFANGTIDDVAQDLVYNEDHPDLRGLDISELYEMKAENARYIKELEQMIKDKKKEKSIETPKLIEDVQTDI